MALGRGMEGNDRKEGSKGHDKKSEWASKNYTMAFCCKFQLYQYADNAWPKYHYSVTLMIIS